MSVSCNSLGAVLRTRATGRNSDDGCGFESVLRGF